MTVNVDGTRFIFNFPDFLKLNTKKNANFRKSRKILEFTSFKKNSGIFFNFLENNY